jgi:predicted transposase YdaD
MRQPAEIDRSLKALIRAVPPAFCRLAGAEVEPGRIRMVEASVNLPEFRADQVLLIQDDTPWAIHVEYQLQPDRRVLRGWFLKNAALSAQLDLPVLLTVVYLARGKRRTFHDAYVAEAGGMRNEFRFQTVRLWEQAARIRGGDLRELAPLLVLCEDNPEAETLEEELRLIRSLDVPVAVRSELVAVAFTVGARFFSRDFLFDLFRAEVPMLKEASIIQEWINEGKAEGRAEGRAEGKVEGKVEGRAEGELAAARRFLLRQLRARFGELPPGVVARVESADRAWCDEAGVRLLTAEALGDLGL